MLILGFGPCRPAGPDKDQIPEVSDTTPTGVVEWVFDGDTIRVGSERVRLIGVDTPETEKPARPGRKGQKGRCFADEATDYLIRRLKGQEVRLVEDPMGERRDRYGRLLAYVYLGETLINRELVEQGFGEAIRYFPYEKKEEFLSLETEAKRGGRGLWGHCR